MMSRDDTNYLTREDVWRELELLPVWRLRAPIETVLAKVTEPKAIEAKEIDKVEVSKVEVLKIEILEVEKPSSAAPPQYEITISQDKHWAFAYETFAGETSISEISMPESRVAIGLDIGGLQSTLLSNILHALQIEKPTITHAQSLADIDAKIIVAMGESMAQLLLNTQDSLENLRGKLHAAGTVHIIATHDLTHLLNYPVDKAKLWQDLCLARSYLQGLQVQY